MVVDRDETLGWLRKEAGSLAGEVNAPYRNHLTSAAELIEMQANELEARAQQVKELEVRAQKLARESEHLLTLHAECLVPQEYLVEGGMAAAGEQLRGEIIRMMIQCGALSMEIRPDIIHGGKVCAGKATVYALKSPVMAGKASETGGGEARDLELAPTKGEKS